MGGDKNVNEKKESDRAEAGLETPSTVGMCGLELAAIPLY